MYEHEEWTPEVLHRYIPRTFETAVITQGIAEDVLYDAVSRAFNDLFASVHTETSRFVGSPRRKIYELAFDGVPPLIPAALRDLPNLHFVKRKPVIVNLEHVQTGFRT